MQEKQIGLSRRFFWVFLALAGTISMSGVFAPQAMAADDRSFVSGVPVDPTEDWTLIFGGRMYDTWWAALGQPAPTATNPLYPKTGTRTGATTWRCRECHGYDYKGVDGVNGKGALFTGIKGIEGANGSEPAKIAALLRSPSHGFTPALIPDDALARLALFVSKGQYDSKDYIDPVSLKMLKGDVDHGRKLFQGVCAACHGLDGKEINFGNDTAPRYVGNVASADPYQSMHKVLNGITNAPMPAWRTIGIQNAVDVLTYAQTLPQK